MMGVIDNIIAVQRIRILLLLKTLGYLPKRGSSVALLGAASFYAQVM